MNIKDVGIIISRIPLKENSTIISVFTSQHGLYSGVVKVSQKINHAIQPGNLVDFFWQARLHEHVGMAKCELRKSYSSVIFASKTHIYAFNSIVSIIKNIFHEREPHNQFFDILHKYLIQLINESIIDFSKILQEYIHLEMLLLTEVGYRLDLEKCAVNNHKDELVYVSPKSGKAISKTVGEPYASKLLPLPYFLQTNQSVEALNQSYCLNEDEIKNAFNLTGYFLYRYLFNNSPLPLARTYFMEHLLSEILCFSRMQG